MLLRRWLYAALMPPMPRRDALFASKDSGAIYAFDADAADAADAFFFRLLSIFYFYAIFFAAIILMLIFS